MRLCPAGKQRQAKKSVQSKRKTDKQIPVPTPTSLGVSWWSEAGASKSHQQKAIAELGMHHPPSPITPPHQVAGLYLLHLAQNSAPTKGQNSCIWGGGAQFVVLSCFWTPLKDSSFCAGLTWHRPENGLHDQVLAAKPQPWWGCKSLPHLLLHGDLGERIKDNSHWAGRRRWFQCWKGGCVPLSSSAERVSVEGELSLWRQAQWNLHEIQLLTGASSSQ